MIYEKIGILGERDPKCLSAKAVKYSKIEIRDIYGNSFTFNKFTEAFQLSHFRQCKGLSKLEYREEGQKKWKEVYRLATKR